MESLTHLVSESFARHGFDRPLDYRRLHWSRWFPCDSPRSLLIVPSRPGVFALAEEVGDIGGGKSPDIVKGRLPFRACPERAMRAEGAASSPLQGVAALAAEGSTPIADGNNRTELIRRMLAVLQFCEDDDMAFVLDRMFSRQNPMRSRLNSGRCFVRFVVLEDQSQRRSICNALNQWLISSSEAATGIGAHFASSLEFTDRSVLNVGAANPAKSVDSSADTNDHRSSPFPSGF